MFRTEFINYFKESKKSLFECLSKKQGNMQFLKWIDSKQEQSQELAGNFKILFDEFSFMQLCQQIFNEFYEHQIYDLFMLFQKNYLVSQEIYLIILLAVSIQENLQLKFVYLYRQVVFKILSQDQQQLKGHYLINFLNLSCFHKNMEYFEQIGQIDYDGEYDQEYFEKMSFKVFSGQLEQKNEIKYVCSLF